MPLVSVVIPAYNAAPWIAETLQSVLAQTLHDFEIIVVDDGSTDETAAVVAKFERVRYLHKPNRGQASARNMGVHAALGEYIAFVDSDDLWSPEKLRLQMDLLRQTGLAWIYCDACAIDDVTRGVLFTFSKVRHQFDGDVLEELFLEDFIPMPTPIVKRQVFEQIGYFDESEALRYVEDWDMWLRISARFPIGLVRRPLAQYRVHAASGIQSIQPQTLYKAHMQVIELAASRDPARLAPLKNRAIVMMSIRIGQMLVRRNDLTRARELFAQAIRLAPGKIDAYAYWLGTIAGRRVTNSYIQMLHWLRRKRSGRLSIPKIGDREVGTDATTIK